MPTQFANTLNNHPIYADRAEKDAAGNTITTTYQEKLTAGTGITIDSSNVISATGGGGGGTYTAGTGIDISAQDAISVKIDGSTITTNGSGQLVANGGGGTSYTAGTGIDITSNTIGVKIDGSTITTNSSGQLVANGGGSSSGITAFHQNVSHLMPPTWTVGDLTFTADYVGSQVTVVVSSSTRSAVYITGIKTYYFSSGSGTNEWRISPFCPGSTSNPYTPVDLTASSYELISTTSTQYPQICDATLCYDTGSGFKLIQTHIMAWVQSVQNMGEIWYSYTSN